MTSPSRRKRPTTPSNTLRTKPFRAWSTAAILTGLTILSAGAGERDTQTDPLRRLKDRSGEARWSEIREKASVPVEVQIRVPMPELERPGLPPITKTIFDQIDSPFGDADEAIVDVESAPVEATPVVVDFGIAARIVSPVRRDERPAAEPLPFPETSVPVSVEAVLQAEETTVGPGTPLFEESAPLFVAQNDQPALPGAQAPPPEAPEPGGNPPEAARNDDPDKELKQAVAGTDGLKPLNAIQPYFDYTPDGGDPYRFLCPRPSDAPADQKYDICPSERPLDEEGNLARAFGATDYMWTASNLFHNPLYFEDPNLERYGQTHGLLQPAYSIGKFGLQLVGMPYQLALDPPARCEYTLGWYRPQEICTPRKKSRIPFNPKAAATAAGAYTGLIFIFP